MKPLSELRRSRVIYLLSFERSLDHVERNVASAFRRGLCSCRGMFWQQKKRYCLGTNLPRRFRAPSSSEATKLLLLRSSSWISLPLSYHPNDHTEERSYPGQWRYMVASILAIQKILRNEGISSSEYPYVPATQYPRPLAFQQFHSPTVPSEIPDTTTRLRNAPRTSRVTHPLNPLAALHNSDANTRRTSPEPEAAFFSPLPKSYFRTSPPMNASLFIPPTLACQSALRER